MPDDIAPASAAPAAPAAPAPAQGLPPPVTPPAAPAPSSAKAKVFGDLKKYADRPARTPGQPAEPVKADDPPAAPAPAKADDTPPAPTEIKKDKPNPWKLYEESKAKLKEHEARITELQAKQITPEREAEIKRLSDRADELEKEIRYVNYTKSQEFQKDYQQPYEAAWKRAMESVGNMATTDAEGNESQFAAGDFLAIVNDNRPTNFIARELEEQYGSVMASELMAHRREVRTLFDKQSAKLEEVKKEGIERDKQRQEQWQQQRQVVTKEIQGIWNQTNEEVKADPKYGKFFAPVEGDQEGNQRLAKGFQLADRAFAENPTQAKNAEERKAIVARHAAVRNRAAAFGRLVYLNSKAETTIAELKAQLAKYQGSEPTPVGGQSQVKPAVTTPLKGMAAVRASLEKYAK